jgi:hypothetical protein
MSEGQDEKDNKGQKAADRPAVTGGANADKAAERAPGPLSDNDNLKERQDQLLDEALEESFPGSDPISPKRIT